MGGMLLLLGGRGGMLLLLGGRGGMLLLRGPVLLLAGGMLLLEDIRGPLVAGYLRLNTELLGPVGLATGPVTEAVITGAPTLLRGGRGPLNDPGGGPLLMGAWGPTP